MKRLFACVICLAPTLALAQQTYTNADLVNIQVPGAYTNDDLKRLPPLAVQKAPAFELAPFAPPVRESAWQASFDRLKRARDLTAAEIDYEIKMIEESESAMAGDPQSLGPRLGYRTGARPLILELRKRVALLELQIQSVVDDARRAGDPVDVR